MDELELSNLRELVFQLRRTNDDLMQSLDIARRRIYDLENSKFTINKIIKKKGGLQEMMMINTIYNTPDGVVVEVS